jgi:predicted TIM-barrel fold metal-dependent hydrolase
VTIDVHGHLSPPESLRRFPMPRSLGDAEAMIETKLAAGVDLTIIGSPVGAGAMVPVPGMDNYAQSEEELARFHDWLGELVARYPRHLRAYVYVNPFGGEAHLEAARARLGQDEFVGLIANTSVAGRYLDHPDAADFFALAAETEAPVLLHAPAAPAAGSGLADLMALEQLGRFADVTIGLACCVLGGWLERHPGLRLVAQGAGGALALLVEKLDRAWSPEHWQRDRPAGAAPDPGLGSDSGPDLGSGGGPRSGAGSDDALGPELGNGFGPGSGSGPGRGARLGPAAHRLPHPPSSYLNRIWADTATPSAAAVELALRVFGPDKVLYGTDSPPLPGASVEGGLQLVERLGISEAQRQAVREDNARTLFGAGLPSPVPAGA